MSTENSSVQDGWSHSIETNFEEVKKTLQTVGYLCDQVTALTKRVESLEDDAENGLEEEVADLHTEVDETNKQIAELLDGLDQAMGQLEEVEKVQTDLDERLAAIEAMYSDTLLEKQHAHNKAQERPTEQVVEEGEDCTLVVEETLYNQPNPYVRGCINGLQVFVEVETREYEKGDEVDFVVTDLQENNANGVEH